MRMKYNKLEEFKVSKNGGYNNPKFFPGGGLGDSSSMKPPQHSTFPLEQQEKLANKLEKHNQEQRKFMSFSPNSTEPQGQKMVGEEDYLNNELQEGFEDDIDPNLQYDEEKKENISNITPAPHDQTNFTTRSELLNALKYFEKSNPAENKSSNIGDNIQKLISLSEKTRRGSGSQPQSFNMSAVNEEPQGQKKPDFPSGAFSREQPRFGMGGRGGGAKQQADNDDEEEEEEGLDEDVEDYHGEEDQGGYEYEDDEEDDDGKGKYQ